MNHICTDVSLWRLPYGFSTKTQKPGALILLYTSRLSSGSAVLVEAEPGVAWNPLYPLDCTRRVFVYASLHICTSHLSLCFSSLSVSLCALRVFRGHPPPPCACCMQLLRLAYAESKVPTSPAA
jgi:hypothetical protein